MMKLRLFIPTIWRSKRKFSGFSKREYFGMVTFVSVLGLIATQFIATSEYYLLIALIVSLGVGVISGLVLWKDARGFRRVASVILVIYYTAAVTFYYSLLPIRWLTRLPVALLYGVGIYVILLSENIYNVATGRLIQLLSVARSFGMAITFLTVYLFFETILSLHMNAYMNGLLFFLVAFPLVFHNLWSMDLSLKIKSMLLLRAFFLGLVVAEIGVGLSFWPTVSTMQAIFLASVFYSIVGMCQQLMVDRLFIKTIKEYILVPAIVFIFVLLTTSWSG